MENQVPKLLLLTGFLLCSSLTDAQNNPRVLEKNFTVVETSVPWQAEEMTYDVHINSPYNITCIFTDAIIKNEYSDVIWEIDNACEPKERRLPAVKNGEDKREEKVGEVIVVPEERVPKSSPSNGSVSLTQVTGAPMHYVNRTHCPVINYRCKVEFPQSTNTDNQDIYHLIKYSGAINITVVDPAQIVGITDNQTVTEGDTLILHCDTTGIPVPEVTWSRVDGGAMPSSVGGGTSIKKREPLNVAVTDKTAGRYKCSAINRVTNSAVERVVDIDVQYAPKVDVQSLIVNQMVGYHTEMSCKATSYPPVTHLSWYYKVEPSESYPINIPGKGENSTLDRYTYTNKSMGSNKEQTTLTVEPVAKEDYKREFCCKFTNSAGVTEKCIALKESRSPVPVGGQNPRKAQAVGSSNSLYQPVLIILSICVSLSILPW